MTNIILLLLVSFIITNCNTPNRIKLTKKSYSDIKAWQIDDHKEALEVFVRSCSKVDEKGWKNLLLQLGPDFNDIGDLSSGCREAIRTKLLNNNAKDFFENNFTPYLVSNNDNEIGLFTGYYELTIKGSYKKNQNYKHPIYSLPVDIEKTTPYFTREKINMGALEGKGLEIAYTDDPVRLFFLHIQGSGIIEMDDGTKLRITYAGQNGHKYFSIGKHFRIIEGIAKEEINAKFIINWLTDYDFKAKEVMDKNKSYIFFKINEQSSPIGAQSVPLTKERSLAIDRRYFPLGAPFWLETSYASTSAPFEKLMISQDTGGAIKGVVRGDVFFGSDKKAEEFAFHMKNDGRFLILLPKK